jgi:hypothetical protein
MIQYRSTVVFTRQTLINTDLLIHAFVY